MENDITIISNTSQSNYFDPFRFLAFFFVPPLSASSATIAADDDAVVDDDDDAEAEADADADADADDCEAGCFFPAPAAVSYIFFIPSYCGSALASGRVKNSPQRAKKR
jgi:hypothetical protein